MIFYWCHKLSKRGVINGTKLNELNVLSRIREIVKQGLRDLFIASSSSHFFNKTNHDQYLFKGGVISSLLNKSIKQQRVVWNWFWKIYLI